MVFPQNFGRHSMPFRCLDRAFFITRALLMTCGKNILPAPKRSPMMPIPRPDGLRWLWWLMDLCHVSRGFLKISGSTWNRHPKEGEIRWTDPTPAGTPCPWLVISFHLISSCRASKNQKIHWEVELLSNFNLQHTLRQFSRLFWKPWPIAHLLR